MDWNGATSWKRREVLRRIFALLLAMAGLAEHASRMPFPVRFVVSRILVMGESVARQFVVGLARDVGVRSPQAFIQLSTPMAVQRAHADRIAQRFLVLALILHTMLTRFWWFFRQFCCDARRYDRRAEWHIRPLGPAGCQALMAIPAPDTS